jgi:hypothetical protein
MDGVLHRFDTLFDLHCLKDNFLMISHIITNRVSGLLDRSVWSIGFFDCYIFDQFDLTLSPTLDINELFSVSLLTFRLKRPVRF